MYMDEPESRNHFAIDSLNRSLLEQSASIIASLFFIFLFFVVEMTQLADDNFMEEKASNCW